MINWIPVKIKFNNGRMADSIFKSARPGKRPHLPDVQTNDDKRRLCKREKRPELSVQPKWKESRGWLQYNDEENKMSCSVCIHYFNKSSIGNATCSNLKNKSLFVTGCSNFRLSSVVDHE